MINSKTKLCCIIGNPVSHSLSPQMHNAAFKALGLNLVFVAFDIKDVRTALSGLKELGIRGIVVTIPHKLEVIKYIDKLDEHASKIGAVNCITNKNGKLFATNTDWYGALRSLEEKVSLDGKTISILGAGGAARAIIYGLKMRNTQIFIFNRTLKKADQLAKEFNLSGSYPLTQISKIRNSDIIINTTSVGMEPNESESPIPENIIRKNHVIFDIVYTPHFTQLLKYGQKKGAALIYGYNMVLYGGIGIFEKFTGKKAPFEIMKNTLIEGLHI